MFLENPINIVTNIEKSAKKKNEIKRGFEPWIRNLKIAENSDRPNLSD